MMKVLKIMCALTVASCISIFSANSLASSNTTHALQHTISPKQASEDFDQWFNWLHQTHPDLSHSVQDVDKFYDTVTRIKTELDTPMTAMAFWQKIAPLNSMLADGHLKVGHGSSSQWREWIAQGVKLFPFEVNIKDDGLYIARDLGKQSSQYRGAKIQSINGTDAETLLKQLLVNTHGDTLAFRKDVLQSQFNRLFYMTFGPQTSFKIEYQQNNKTKHVTLDAKAAIPTALAKSSFSDEFNVSYHNKTAVLQVNTFAWDDFKQFLNYMDSVFTEIKERKINHLIIDISRNGGGNDDMWMAGIMRYIADKPYRHFSTYRSKVLLKYRDPGQLVGAIEQGENTRLIEPETHLTNFYRGKTSLLIGTGTYSSSIVFANTVQDHQFAQLIGQPTGGRSTQSGGIQFMHLTHSQLQMISPRFILTRPSGNQQMTPVQPELSIEQLALPEQVKAML